MAKKTLSNVLALSCYNDGFNRIFEDYCNGIKANCKQYHYIDYVNLYLGNGKQGFEKYIELYIEENKVDAVFLIWWSCDLTFDLEFLERLSKKTRLIMNFFDTEYYFESVDRYYAQLADLVVLPDEMACCNYKYLDINVHNSFSLFDQSYYKYDGNLTKDIDVSFVGNIKNADRSEYIKYLKENGVNIQAYGAGSDNGFVEFDQMVSIFNRSKINLNFTTLSQGDGYIVPISKINQRVRQSKGRAIESSLCGGFVLTQYANGIEKMFEVGEEFDVFRTKEELLEKIRYYLAQDKIREKMQRRAYQRAQNNYTINSGFNIIFEKIESMSAKREYPVYADEVFKRCYTAYRFMYISRYLLSGKFAFAFEEFRAALKYKNFSLSMSYYFVVKGVVFYLLAKPSLYKKLKRVKDFLKLKVKY